MRGRAFAVSYILLLSMVFGLIVGCSAKTKKKTLTLFALDTYVTITAEGEDSERSVSEAAALLAELEGKLSRQKDGSEISKLNSSSEENPVTLSPEVYAILETVCLYAEGTDGLFDPTIATLMDLWGFGNDPHVPSESDIAAALERIDYRKIHLLSGNQAYVDEGVKVDLGASAKGAIGQILMKKMKTFSVSKVILDLGGNVCAWAEKSELTVGVISPTDPTKLCCIYSLSKEEEMSVITSGAYERYFEENGVRYGHIMDTNTGYPVETDLLSATVIGKDGTVGDILATVFFAYGCDKAKAIASLTDTDCILCSENGTLWVSSSLEGKVHEQEGWTIKYFS